MKLPTFMLKDADRRACRWMVRRAPLQDAHRNVLEAIDRRSKLTAEDRAFVRALFSVYKPGPVDEGYAAHR